MQKLDATQIAQASAVMCRALSDDLLHRYIFPDERFRARRMLRLYRFKLTSQLQHCYVPSDDIEGVAIWERPGQHSDYITLDDVRHAILFPFQMGPTSLLRMIGFQGLCSRVRKGLIRDPYWYLDVVVVDPVRQGRGVGGRLMRPFLDEAESLKQPVYLETQHPNNVTMYQRYGFRIAHREPIPGTALNQHCMIRD